MDDRNDGNTKKIKTKLFYGWGDGSVGKALLDQGEDRNSDLQSPHKC